MKIHRFALLAALALPTLAVAAPAADTAKLSASDLALVAHAHAVNRMEIAMGKLAQATSHTASVKGYGVELGVDHNTADKDLVKLAKQHGVATIPDDVATSADDAAMAEMTKLQALKGAAFDTEFLAAMIDGHDKELAKLRIGISNANDQSLIKLLTAVQPVMQKHEDEATKLAAKLNAKS